MERGKKKQDETDETTWGNNHLLPVFELHLVVHRGVSYMQLPDTVSSLLPCRTDTSYMYMLGTLTGNPLAVPNCPLLSTSEFTNPPTQSGNKHGSDHLMSQLCQINQDLSTMERNFAKDRGADRRWSP